MTKKRQRDTDFQKVKLKVGKKKPRADNETNTNFKTRAITVPEQLKATGSQPTTKRKLSIDTLLTQLHHYGTTVRQGALGGLKELVEAHPELVPQHLSSLVDQVTPLLTDREALVRQGVVAVLRSLYPRVDAARLSPFVPTLSAHLASAMTHLSEGVQLDALQALDAILETFPQLLVRTASGLRLLGLFVQLISRGGSQVKGDKAPRRLLVNPSGHLTSQQWRLRVLARLARFLGAVLRETDVDGEGEVRPAGALHVDWPSCQRGVEVFEHSGLRPMLATTFRLCPVSMANSSEMVVGNDLSHPEGVRTFVHTLVPLLLECWVEAALATEEGDAPIPGSEGLAVMVQVANTMLLLWRLVIRHGRTLGTFFRDTYFTDFKLHFLKNFPYSMCENVARKSKQKGAKKGTDVTQDTVLGLNLNLAELLASVAEHGCGPGGWGAPATVPAGRRAAQPDALEPVEHYVAGLLSGGSRLPTTRLGTVLAVVRTLLATLHTQARVEGLLRAVFAEYQQRSVTVANRLRLLRFFRSLYVDEGETSVHVRRSKVLSRWLMTLPPQLIQLGARCPAFSAELVEVIRSAAAHANPNLLASLSTHACHIYDPTDGVLGSLVADAATQRHLLQLLYHLPVFPEGLPPHLAHFCLDARFPAEMAKTVIRMMHHRACLGTREDSEEAPFPDTAYLGFMFSVLIGVTAQELSALKPMDLSQVTKSRCTKVDLSETSCDRFLRHAAINEVVCWCLGSVPSRPQLLEVLGHGFESHLTGVPVLPDTCALGLLSGTTRLWDPGCNPELLPLALVAACTRALLQRALASPSSGTPAQGEQRRRQCVLEACESSLATLPGACPALLSSLLEELEELTSGAPSAGDREPPAPQREHARALAPMLQWLMQEQHLRPVVAQSAQLLGRLVQTVLDAGGADCWEQWKTDLKCNFTVFMSQSQV